MGFKRLFAETTPGGSRLNLKWLPRLEFQPLLICFLLGASAAQADESFWTELSLGSARVIEASRPCAAAYLLPSVRGGPASAWRCS
ncbi:MAG: hypothetical protein CM15mP74_16920 [Halieaceae bacterium]|nr:MAG: hypothetical protein CM15mP74_16920 [Halieaceae bacterium]